MKDDPVFGPKFEDITAPPCNCSECEAADVIGELQRRDPHTGRLLHGYDLKRWLDTRDAFMRAARAAVGPRGRHAGGFERLVNPPKDDK